MKELILLITFLCGTFRDFANALLFLSEQLYKGVLSCHEVITSGLADWLS